MWFKFLSHNVYFYILRCSVLNWEYLNPLFDYWLFFNHICTNVTTSRSSFKQIIPSHLYWLWAIMIYSSLDVNHIIFPFFLALYETYKTIDTMYGDLIIYFQEVAEKLTSWFKLIIWPLSNYSFLNYWLIISLLPAFFNYITLMLL